MKTSFQQLSITLAKDLPRDPAHAIDEFFQAFGPKEIHFQLTELLTCALVSGRHDFEEAIQRSNAIFFCERTWYALQALHMLHESQKANGLLANLQSDQ